MFKIIDDYMIKKYILLLILFCITINVTYAQIEISGTIKYYRGECLTVSYPVGRKDVVDTLQVDKNGAFVYKNEQYIPIFFCIAKGK